MSTSSTKSHQPFFPEIIGQERACRIIERIIASILSEKKQGRGFPPLLFVGPVGVGKRTIAFKFAQTVNCEKGGCGFCPTCRAIAQLTHPDFRLIFPTRKPKSDASPEETIYDIAEKYPNYILGIPQPPVSPNYQISIQAIRWLRNEMAKPPVSAKIRFFVILNAHQMREEAQSALLKTLEEPQVNTVLILTTSVPSALFDTIRSRTQIIRFAPLPEEQIIAWLKHKKVKSDHLGLAVALAQGSLGKALMILNNPNAEEFLIPALLTELLASANPKAIFKLINQLKDIPLPAILNTIIFLHRNTLRGQLNCSHLAAWVSPQLFSSHPFLLLQKIRYLHTRLQETSLNTNHLLTLSTLLLSFKDNSLRCK